MPSIRIKRIHVSPRFFKSFAKLPPSIQALAKEKDILFRTNPFDSRLRTHKLKGQLAGVWAYWVTHSYRVLFRFLADNEALYYDIGTHDVYR
ncbi:MAG: type II toxin-antitoxin system mRNA interferase toxin, RelE/StbE family [Candidatus Omnitrophica bacterium]|nr:type II toxin-antitoxin system mRNA interferase toxin, RelE/StbE family [Candidatus Omnitrophota bacterium]